jgi:hypothetical protein
MKTSKPSFLFFFLIQICFARMEIRGQAVSLQVSGIPYSINGQDSVPVGLFGVHSSSLTPERVSQWGVEMSRGIEAGPSGSPSFPGKNSTFPAGIKMTIDCYFDRFQPALYLTNRNGWKSQLENLATTYANNSLSMSHKPILEFWNEPFLNWASKPGANYDNRWYDVADTAQGAPVRRPGFTEPVKHLTWDKRKWWTQLSPPVNDPVNFYVQLSSNWTALNNLAIGEEIQIGSRRFRAVNAWLAKDSSQISFYSSKANAEMYNQMYKTFAQKVKEINTEVKVLAGWGMSFSNDNWQPFRTIYQSTIDSCWQWMDGVHEHHYGGDIRFMVGAYEVVNAYGKIKYGKNLPIYNTETGGFTDPQIPGGSTSGPPSDPLVRDRGAFQYTFRELAFNLCRSPDKLKSRASHETHLYNGYGVALNMLKDFRGKLISCTSENDNVWCLSALNGNRLVVAVYNDLGTAQNIQLQVKAPKGFQFADGIRKWVEDSVAANAVSIKSALLQASGMEWSQSLSLALKSGTVLSLDLTGVLQDSAMVMQQYFADTLLARVPANGSLQTRISLPANDLAQAKAARLKMYIRNYSTGSLNLNGNAVTNLQSGFFTYIPLDLSLLQTNNLLNFQAGSSAYDVNFASIELIKGSLDSNLISEVGPLHTSDFGFEVFPNPCEDHFLISASEANAGAEILLHDMLGRRVKSFAFAPAEKMETKGLKPGLYWLHFQGKAKKLVKL